MTTITYYPATDSGVSTSATHGSRGFETSLRDSSTDVVLPSFSKMALTRAMLDIKSFMRDKESLIWVFAFPLIFLGFFSLMFGSEAFVHPEYDHIMVSGGTVFLPGLIAFGVLLCSFQSVSSWIAQEREKGGLKRLSATPLTPAAYFAGKMGMVIVTMLAQIIVLIGAAVAFFGAALPATPTAWLNFIWLVLLGSAAGTVLGVFFSNVGKTAKANSNIASGILTVLSFASGVFLVAPNFPVWLTRIAQVFPLYWLASGMRSVFMPAEMYSFLAVGEAPQLWLGAIVLGAWVIVGLLLATRTFQWNPRR